jgi:hypothetical protein
MASVPAPVIGLPEIENTLGTEAATEVTVPAPAGVAQAPSPRQKVEAEALVPLFKLVTGKLPVTPVLKGSPVAFVRVPLLGVPKAPPEASSVPVVGSVTLVAAVLVSVSA